MLNVMPGASVTAWCNARAPVAQLVRAFDRNSEDPCRFKSCLDLNVFLFGSEFLMM